MVFRSMMATAVHNPVTPSKIARMPAYNTIIWPFEYLSNLFIILRYSRLDGFWLANLRPILHHADATCSSLDGSPVTEMLQSRTIAQTYARSMPTGKHFVVIGYRVDGLVLR